MAHQSCSVNFAGPNTYHPTKQGGVWSVGTWRMSTDPADSVFALGGRDAIIRGIYVGYSAGGTLPVIQIVQRSTGAVVAEYLSQRNQQTQWLPGPEGIRVPGGFYIVVTLAAGSIQVVYDVV